MSASSPVDVRPAVAADLQAGRPVVAMTTAALAHSLPWPDNLEIARLVETTTQQEGVTLAFVAVWQGRLTVGLLPDEVEALARGGSTLRAGRRDLATCVVRHKNAATTVSASVYLACQAGIRLLVTGAIGGVAHGIGHNWDVSADLTELSRNPVAVVTSGVRSVTDLSSTAEVLESYGVPVVGYGTESFPVFYQRPANQLASVQVDAPAEAAALLAAHWSLGGAGVVVANPTPGEVALSPDELQPALAEVKQQALAAKVGTRDLPPFLMGRLNRLTKGRALRAYRGSLEANARLAAEIARELCDQANSAASGSP